MAGLPPLAGFLGKALLLQAAGQTPLAVWVVAGVLGSSLATMLALARAGSVLFWKPQDAGMAVSSRQPTDRQAPQDAAIVGLLIAVLALAVGAGALAAYTTAAATQLLDRDGYIRAVLGALPR